MSRKDERLSEQYCSGNPSKPTIKSESDGSTWKQSGVSVSTKSLQSSSSYDNSLYDSGRTDSGFLSGANLLSSDYLSEEISTPLSSSNTKEFDNSGEIKVDKGGIMRLDSGVDVGLDDKLSSLSLNDSPTNDLSISSGTKSKSFISCNNITGSYDSDFSSQKQRSVPVSASNTKTSPLLSWDIYFQQDEDGETQLHIAILHCFIEVVYSLIKMVPGSEYLDIRNDACQTPLHLAVLTGQHNIVRWLLSEGASPDILDMHGNTALHLAVSMQDICCVNALVSPISSDTQNTISRSSAPVYINRYNYDGLTCLHLAVMGGNIDIVKRLLDYGADVNAKEYKSGLSPLHIAIQMRNEVLSLFLLNYCRDALDLETETYAGITAYQLACREHPSLADRLQQFGAKWYPLDDSDDEEFDEDDDEHDEPFGQPPFDTFRINGTNGMVNVRA